MCVIQLTLKESTYIRFRLKNYIANSDVHEILDDAISAMLHLSHHQEIILPNKNGSHSIICISEIALPDQPKTEINILLYISYRFIEILNIYFQSVSSV